jgi:hypothetical protein
LVQRVIVQEKVDRQHQAGLEYSFALTTEHYDANGKRTGAQTVRAIAKEKASIEYTADLKSEASGATKNYEEASPGLKDNQAFRAQLDLTKLAPRFVTPFAAQAKWKAATAGLWGTDPRQELLLARAKRKSLTHSKASSGLIRRLLPSSDATERPLNR